MKGVFITGTDTNVGKTITSALLMSALKQTGRTAKYFKPVQTGLDDDTKTLKQLTECDFIESSYKFRDPISPHRAAALANEIIDLRKIKTLAASDAFLVVEGAGGIMVPLNLKENTRDLIELLGFPLIIVCSTQLGTINHTLLTLEAARKNNIKIKGLVLVGTEDPGLKETLVELGDLSVLVEIPSLDISQKEIRERGPQIFPEEILSRICDS